MSLSDATAKIDHLYSHGYSCGNLRGVVIMSQDVVFLEELKRRELSRPRRRKTLLAEINNRLAEIESCDVSPSPHEVPMREIILT